MMIIRSAAEPCYFDTVLVQVRTSYVLRTVPGSGSLQNFTENFKLKFLSLRFLLRLHGNRLILA
jgi:hypothetical protein